MRGDCAEALQVGYPFRILYDVAHSLPSSFDIILTIGPVESDIEYKCQSPVVGDMCILGLWCSIGNITFLLIYGP